MYPAMLINIEQSEKLQHRRPPPDLSSLFFPFPPLRGEREFEERRGDSCNFPSSSSPHPRDLRQTTFVIKDLESNGSIVDHCDH